MPPGFCTVTVPVCTSTTTVLPICGGDVVGPGLAPELLFPELLLPELPLSELPEVPEFPCEEPPWPDDCGGGVVTTEIVGIGTVAVGTVDPSVVGVVVASVGAGSLDPESPKPPTALVRVPVAVTSIARKW